jgi:hypothetical protein
MSVEEDKDIACPLAVLWKKTLQAVRVNGTKRKRANPAKRVE